MEGFGKLLQTVDLVGKRINPKLKVKWVLLCLFDSRASLPSEVKTDIEQFLSNARGTNCAWSQAQILPVHIRTNIKLAEAPGYGKTIFEYEQNCHGAEDYGKVADFIHTESEPLPQPDVAEQSTIPGPRVPPPIEIKSTPQLDSQPPLSEFTQPTPAAQEPNAAETE